MAGGSIAKLKRLRDGARSFVEQVASKGAEGEGLRWLPRLLRFCAVTWRQFVRNRCPVRASALAYTTLLALVPLLAIALGVASSLLKAQGQEQIQTMLTTFIGNVAPQLNLVQKGEEQSEAGVPQVVRQISQYIGKIQSGALNTGGTIALVFLAISLLSTVEATFNDIWGVTRGRKWLNRIVYYWTAITLGPLILVTCVGLVNAPDLNATKEFIERLPIFGEILFQTLLRLTPFVISILAFSFFYLWIPNTKVNWKAALVGGVVGGCLWQLNNIFNFVYVARVVTYSKIYGSLAVVPVFLLGLYLSWLILLLGAQVAHSYQNRHTLQQPAPPQFSAAEAESLALHLMTVIGRRFQKGQAPLPAEEIAGRLGIPGEWVDSLFQGLQESHLLVEVAMPEHAFSPTRPLNQITADQILQSVRTRNRKTVWPAGKQAAEDPVGETLAKIRSVEHGAAATISLESIVLKSEAVGGSRFEAEDSHA